tara:strand:+ start:144 stop:617 length:474 start_codon:yes stop_codon:yes gene_type:complete
MSDTARIIGFRLDDTFGRGRRPEVEQERAVAIEDLLDENSFALDGGPAGPYQLVLGMADNRLLFQVQNEAGVDLKVIGLALGPFRRIIRDYHGICESYYDAIRRLSPMQIETIDMARRGLHNDGTELLLTRLSGKAIVDFDTGRRLFTLLCVLHMKG